MSKGLEDSVTLEEVPQSVAHYDEYYLQIENIRKQNGRGTEQRAQMEAGFGYMSAMDVIGSDSVIMDVPCGLGYHSQVLATIAGRNPRIIGVDGSSANINFARRKFCDPRVSFERGLFLDLKDVFGGDSANVIFCFGSSFGLYKDPKDNVEHMKVMMDVLKSGGKLVIQSRCGERYAPGYCGDTAMNEPKKGPVFWGMDEQGRKVGYYTVEYPASDLSYVFPEEYLPEHFYSLKGDTAGALKRRTINFERFQHVYISHTGDEILTPAFEHPLYLEPEISGIDHSGRLMYDMPLVRAICEYSGLCNVRIIPAEKLVGNTWMVGVVASKD